MARVRPVHGTVERLLASPYVITQPRPERAFWVETFGREAPFVLEVGSGRGRFLYEAGKAHPEINFIGLDIVPEIIMEALDKYSTMKDWPPHIRFISTDAALLLEVLPEGLCDEIYLPFSDPWPKRRHAKRRLTYRAFLDIYARLLAPEGRVIYKTDHADFYRWSRKSFLDAGWRIIDENPDLYGGEPPADNIPTEYERRYHKKGTPIGRLIVLPPA